VLIEGKNEMAYKFEKLEVWQLALEYLSLIYAVAENSPPIEEYNLKSQIVRAGTGITLNIGESSTSRSDPEQACFLVFAIRSLIEYLKPSAMLMVQAMLLG